MSRCQDDGDAGSVQAAHRHHCPGVHDSERAGHKGDAHAAAAQQGVRTRSHGGWDGEWMGVELRSGWVGESWLGGWVGSTAFYCVSRNLPKQLILESDQANLHTLRSAVLDKN